MMKEGTSSPITLILASASPRRQELISLLGLPYQIIPSRYEEPPPPTEPTSLPELVTQLASSKAREVSQRLGTQRESGADESRSASHNLWVLGADTLVTLDEEYGVPLGKPTSVEDAKRMLRLLSGRFHFVYTGIALIPISPAPDLSHADVSSEPIYTAAVKTKVRLRQLTETMLSDYVATGEPMDKAGAYGAQGYAAPLIEGFEGDFFNVVGLPLCEVGKLLERAGIDWWHNRGELPRQIG